MSKQRTHYVATTDGVTIGGTVHGHGPALVFLQGAVGDGDLDWQRVLAHLTDKYTCHLPPAKPPQPRTQRRPPRPQSQQVEDFATYVDSIGEPVALVGWSGGGYFALGLAASRPETVAAVAPWEPGILSLMDDAEKADVGASLTRTAETSRTDPSGRTSPATPSTDVPSWAFGERCLDRTPLLSTPAGQTQPSRNSSTPLSPPRRWRMRPSYRWTSF